MVPTMFYTNLFNPTKTLISRHVSPVNEWANKLLALFMPNTSRAMATATSHFHEGGLSQCKKCLTLNSMNPCIIEMQYAVRGPLVIRASEIEKELEKVIFYVVDHLFDKPNIARFLYSLLRKKIT